MTTQTKKMYLDCSLSVLDKMISDRKKTLRKARKTNQGMELLQKCLNETCSNKGIKLCNSCLYYTFCSPECQKAQWKKHKPFCSEIKYCMDELKRKQSLFNSGLLDGDELNS